MTLHVTILGADDLALEHLVLDVNGTLTDRGEPIISALRVIECLRDVLELHVLSADTFGTAEALAASIRADYRRVDSGHAVSTGSARWCALHGHGDAERERDRVERRFLVSLCDRD